MTRLYLSMKKIVEKYLKMTGVSFGTAKSSAGRGKLDQYEIKQVTT